jgi:methyl-accepting chemotaxis protein
MRDGEKILEFTDENGNKIIRDIIEHTKENHDSVYINHYGWKNIGEDALLMRVSACSYLSQRDWIICSSTYHSDFLNGLEKIKKNIIIVGLVAVVFGSAIAYFFALFISRPINALEKNSTIAASGNLNIEFGRELLQSSGEVGSLARSFNIMLVNLRNKIAETEESRRALIMSNEQLLKAKQDVEGKNIELEKFNKMAVGRELKMVELKARIRDLEGKKVYKDEKL